MDSYLIRPVISISESLATRWVKPSMRLFVGLSLVFREMRQVICVSERVVAKKEPDCSSSREVRKWLSRFSP